MLDCLVDGLLDTLKILPYLFLTFLILELVEHKLSKKNENLLTKNPKIGPVLGGLLGALPQCGFSAMAANLFSSGVITIGTLIAIFLSTSDEMLPIMLGESFNLTTILEIIGFKILIGIIVGVIVDQIYKRRGKSKANKIGEICEKEHCHCGHDGVLLSSLIHTFKIGLFILIANLVINLAIFHVGEETLSNILLHKNVFVYFLASLVGLIPNCASSVIITELYISGLITAGTMIAGLLTGSGLGLLLLFRTNKDLKENLFVLSVVYFVGVVVGTIVDFLGFQFAL